MEKLKTFLITWFNNQSETRKKMLKFAGVIFLVMVLASLFRNAEASGYHEHVVNNTVVEQSISNEVNRSALGVADLQFNLATPDLQWAASASKIDDSQAGKFAIGQKMDNVFVSGTVARENGHTGFGVSVSGKF